MDALKEVLFLPREKNLAYYARVLTGECSLQNDMRIPQMLLISVLSHREFTFTQLWFTMSRIQTQRAPLPIGLTANNIPQWLDLS